MFKKIIHKMLRTSKHFKQYLVYNSLSSLVCGIETTMSTHSMFKASGVVDNVDMYSVLFNMTMKDVIGQLAIIPVFPLINKMSKYGDTKPLRYLGINIGIYEISTIIEHCTPMLSSSLFIYVAGVANIGKTVGLVGSSSFNVSMISKLSDDGKNIMELNSKISTMSTIAFAVGNVIGLGIVKTVPCYETRLCLLPFMGGLRYWFSLKSIKGLV